MMKLPAPFLILLVLSAVCFGQKADKPAATVIWSADPGCHQDNSADVKALKPECSSVQIENVTYNIISYGGVLYAMSRRPVRDYMVASVQITNKSDAPIQLNLNRSRLGLYKSQEDYAANGKAEFSPYQSQDDLRRASYRESSVVGERDGEIRSGLRVQERHEDVRGKDQRIISRTTIYDPAAPQSEDPAPSVITSSLMIPRSVFDNILKAKTVAPKEKIAGHLVFRNFDDVKGYRVLYLNVGTVAFVFPDPPK